MDKQLRFDMSEVVDMRALAVLIGGLTAEGVDFELTQSGCMVRLLVLPETLIGGTV